MIGNREHVVGRTSNHEQLAHADGLTDTHGQDTRLRAVA